MVDYQKTLVSSVALAWGEDGEVPIEKPKEMTVMKEDKVDLGKQEKMTSTETLPEEEKEQRVVSRGVSFQSLREEAMLSLVSEAWGDDGPVDVSKA